MIDRKLGTQGLVSSAIGLGCMGMSFAYGTAESRDDAESLATLEAAFELGITHFDSAEVYGPWHNEELIARFLPSRREKVVITSKFGFTIGDDRRISGLDGSAINAKRACEASLKRLGTDYLDLYYLHRLDPRIPVEESIGAMAELVRAGKVRYLGLSEVSAATLRRAASVHPISVLQSEYSLWERGIEREILPTCRELGVGLVPYCPLGRGFLTGTVRRAEEYAEEGDMRAHQPRFQADNYDRNQRLSNSLARLATKKGCTPAQLAIAWLLAQGDDIVPIPGTRRRAHLKDNVAAASVTLAACDLMALEEMFPRGAAAGDRYGATQMAWIDR
jgi:aryl-alcohol dehydrogenase-like predicted oxidoreductase